MISSYFGESAANLRAVFEGASQRPTVLLLDECDFIARSRGDSKDIGEASRIVNQLLQLMEDYDAPGLLVATTNVNGSDSAPSAVLTRCSSFRHRGGRPRLLQAALSAVQWRRRWIGRVAGLLGRILATVVRRPRMRPRRRAERREPGSREPPGHTHRGSQGCPRWGRMPSGHSFQHLSLVPPPGELGSTGLLRPRRGRESEGSARHRAHFRKVNNARTWTKRQVERRSRPAVFDGTPLVLEIDRSLAVGDLQSALLEVISRRTGSPQPPTRDWMPSRSVWMSSFAK